MLITFKSRAGADVIMFGNVASQMLKVMGKDPEEVKGIVTVEQLPRAIENLVNAIAQDKNNVQEPVADPMQTSQDEEPKESTFAVSFSQRAVPLLDLLRYALKDSEVVVWE